MPDIAMAPYVLGAYMLAWAVLVGYAVYLGAKITGLQREIKHLEDIVEK